VAREAEKGHGRAETRQLETTAILTLHGRWPGLKQGLRITRTRTVKGVKTTEVHYGITSLTEQEAGAKRLLRLVRGHWQIENALHWVRDVTLGEDKCRVRKGGAAQALAAMRNAVVHLVSGPEYAEEGLSRAGVLRHLSANVSRPLRLIGLSPLE
jgi:hypothetical protein